jgi:hypothetical protein
VSKEKRQEALTESFMLTVEYLMKIGSWLTEKAIESMSGWLDGCCLCSAELNASSWELLSSYRK